MESYPVFMDCKTYYCYYINTTRTNLQIHGNPHQNPNSIKKKKKILKFMWNLKGPQIAKTIWKNNNTGGLTLPDFNTSYIAIVIKTM